MELLFPVLFFIPFVLVAAMFGVWIWALVDALLVPADIFYRTGSKILWGVLIGVMGPLAGIVYFAVGRPDGPTRSWIAAQKAAGVDLNAYRIYDQPLTRPSPYAPPPPYGTPPPPGTWSQPSSASWPPGGPEGGQGPPPGYPPWPPG